MREMRCIVFVNVGWRARASHSRMKWRGELFWKTLNGARRHIDVTVDGKREKMGG